MAIRNSRPNPYVGPRPFRTGERLYGRERQIRELLDRLIAERIVLLHSPSGAGKTSLIRAGLLPRLLDENFHVLPVMRVNQQPANNLKTNRYVYSAMLSLEEELGAVTNIPDDELKQISLGEYLERYKQAVSQGEEKDSYRNVVLVFDQFEEILTINPTDTAGKAEFFSQVGIALRDRRRWALFSMREDYTAALDPYVRPLPTRLHSTYRLDLLDVGSARQAIQEPVKTQGVKFTDRAANELIDDLRSEQVQLPDGSLEERQGPYVEPVQLQVVCYRLWQNLASDDMEISIEDIESAGDVSESLGKYYAERVEAVSGKLGTSERSIRDWFEKKLITEQGIRSQVIMTAESSEGLPNEAIQELRDAHLVRAEKRRNITWFELAHDRLVKPVKDNNTAWYKANLSLLQRQASLWDEQKRPAGLLLRDDELLEAERWERTHEGEATDLDREFLEACQRARSEQEQVKKEQALRLETAQKLAETEKQRAEEQFQAAKRIRQRLMVAVAAGGLALILGMVAVVFWNRAAATSSANATLAAENARIAEVAQTAQARAVEQQSTAEFNARVAARNEATAEAAAALAATNEANAQAAAAEAERQARIALSGQLAAQSEATQLKYPMRSLLLSVEAIKVPEKENEPEPPIARQALYDALANAGGKVLKGHSDDLWAMAFSPDGHWLATGGVDRRVYLWDITSEDPAVAPVVLQKLGETQEGHEGEVTSLAFSPEGHWLASGGRDQMVILWDLQAEDPRQSALKLQGHANIIDTIAISRDGHWLASGDRNGIVRLWDLTAEDIQASSIVLEGHTSDITALAFIPNPNPDPNPDEYRLASASTDTTVILWVVSAGQVIGEQKITLDHNGQVLTLAISPDGRWLASGCKDQTVWVWDLAAGEPAETRYVLEGHENEVRIVAFSPDGDTLASTGLDSTVRLWRMRQSRPDDTPVVLRKHSGAIQAMAFSPDGRWLASGGTDFNGWLWDLSQPDPGKNPLGLRGHEDTIRAIAFSPDGRWAATGGNDNLARLWDLRVPGIAASPLMLTGHGRNVRALSFTSDGRWLASASDDAQIRVWDLQSNDPLSNYRMLAGHEDDIRGLATSPDGRWLASGGGDRQVMLWDLSDERSQLKPIILGRHGNKIWTVAFSPDGRWLASSSRDGTVRLWDMSAPEAGIEPVILGGHSGDVFSIAFSPDGKLLASGDGNTLENEDGVDGIVRVWDLSGEAPDTQPINLSGHEGIIQSVAFSQDGRWLASGGEDKIVRLWDLSALKTGLQPIELEGHKEGVLVVAFSPDGRRLASGSQDHTTRLWDLQSPQFPEKVSVQILRRHIDDVLAISFSPESPDTRWLATSSGDSTTVLWDLLSERTGTSAILMKINDAQLGGISNVWEVAISPDGRWLASGSKDGIVRVWGLALGSLRETVCSMTGRNLTRDEWLQYQPWTNYEKTCEQWP